MTDLVIVDGKRILRTSTARLAEWFNVNHLQIMRLVEKYNSDFLDLWKIEEWKENLILTSEIRIRNKKSKVFLLNEMQVNFLWTLTDNTATTVAFKKHLVKEFERQRNILKKLIENQQWLEFIWALPQWKATRRTLTDAIQDYNDYREQRLLKKDERIFSNITKLVNTQLFDFWEMLVDKTINKRSLLSEKQRRKLNDVEDDLVEIIMNNLDDPYKKVKEYLEMRLKFVNKSIVIDDQLRIWK